MNSLIWVTPPGLVAEILSGVQASVQIQALDIADPQTSISFTLIGGSLPQGMMLNSAGVITGIPVYAQSSNVQNATGDFKFIVRAQTGLQVLDGQFSVRVASAASSGPQWITPGGNLGTVPAGEFYSLSLETASTSNLVITYTQISGSLPGGMRVTKSGLVQGVPEILNAVIVDQSVSYEFSVRATDSRGIIADRAFSLTITDVTGPVIEPAATSLGTVLDGSYFSQQLSVPEPSPNTKISWQVVAGNLPQGVSLSANGLLSGYVYPLQLVGNFGPAGYDGDALTDGVITDQQQFDSSPYDFNQLNQSLTYDFTVQAYDGANYTSRYYTLTVISRTSLTADTSQILNDLDVTIDTLTDYYPVLLDSAKTLPVARQDSYYAYKFQGYDFQNYAITYGIAASVGTFDAYVLEQDAGFDYVPFDSYDTVNSPTVNLPGLTLDGQSGWLYGRVNPQTSALANYVFGITVSKSINGRILSSMPVYFTLPVLGDVNNVINWVSPSDLGSINNGDVSELSIVAQSTVDLGLVYALVDKPGIPCRLPQGLTLLPSGAISGRVSFEHFSMDQGNTTFDDRALTIDQRYDFYAQVQTTDGSAQNTQLFTIHLNIVHAQPHDDLYLRALPTRDQREIYSGIINNTNIFDPAVIYRATDPYFGIQPAIRMLFLSGLDAKTLAVYEQAMQYNHYLKTYDLGAVKTAAVLDDNFNIKYEVVYLEIADPEENLQGQGPGLVLDLTGVIANPHVDATGAATKIFYPNTSENMVIRLEAGVGIQDQSSLPEWMTSNQPGPNGTFLPPLGYVKAAVLAYTLPGGAELIAHRISEYAAEFTGIQFIADRYEIDDYYSSNYVFNQGFMGGSETTFDASFRNVGHLVATVQYALSVPFDAINSRSVDFINSLKFTNIQGIDVQGGMDGILNFSSGDLVIFAKQEEFPNTDNYDGWVNYTDLFIGDNSLTASVEGYDSAPYDSYAVVPGYLEKIQGTSPTNKRGGVWQVNIVNNIVNLTFVQEIQTNDRVRITSGATYASATLTYTNRNLVDGQSVPYYEVFATNVIVLPKPTTFNDNTTRFFSRRDQYYTPESRDKYLKFTQYGAAD
jgi:Putative Ig domain